MILFKRLQSETDKPNYGEVQESGRIWIQDGRIQARGNANVMAIASSTLQQTFGPDIDPATDPQAFLAALPLRYHGTYFWAEEAPDDTPVLQG